MTVIVTGVTITWYCMCPATVVSYKCCWLWNKVGVSILQPLSKSRHVNEGMDASSFIHYILLPIPHPAFTACSMEEPEDSTKNFIVCGCTGGSEQQEEQRYQGIYHTHLANRDQKSYTPRIECEVDWTTCKSLSFCSRLSVRQLILQCGQVMFVYPTCLKIPSKQRMAMSCNSLPLGTCRELWLIIPSPWLQLPASEVQDFTSNSHNASIVLLFTVYVTEPPLQFSNELVNIKKWLWSADI